MSSTDKPSYEDLESKLEASSKVIRDLIKERFEEKEYRPIQEVSLNISPSGMRDKKGRFIPGRFVDEMRARMRI